MAKVSFGEMIMDGKKTFDVYYSRLAREGLIKSALVALILGFAANFAVAFFLWFLDLKEGWIPLVVSIAVGVAVFAGMMPLFYIKRFRPTAQKIADRIDRLGLDERLITMLELEGDESYIALRQREDAKVTLRKVDHKHIKFRFPKIIIAGVAILAVLGISMTTVSTLSASGAVPSGSELIESLNPEEEQFLMVNYMVVEGGYIEGEAEQLVLPGEDTSLVIAVADDGYVFAGWSDGYEEPDRYEENVQEDMEIEAYFIWLEDMDPQGSEGEPGDSDEGDSGAPDTPQNQESEQDSDSQQSPSDGNEDDSNNEPGGGSGGRYEENNKIDTEGANDVYYRDVLDEYLERMREILESGGDLPPELRSFVEKYFDVIG